MRVKFGLILSLLAVFVIGVIAPVRASAQPQYYYQNPDYQYNRDRRWREREWREQQRREWREHQRREWREHQRDRDRDWR